MKKVLYLLFAVSLLSACEKELSLEAGVIVQPKPEPVDTVRKYQLKAFYSDIPIDFDETDDEVRLETDLWKYVLEYLKDDYHVLRTDTTVEVVQNDIKKPGTTDEILYRSYSRGTDNLGEYINYLTPHYNQMKYRLYEWTDDYFIIGVKWKDGAKVYSRFERVK